LEGLLALGAVVGNPHTIAGAASGQANCECQKPQNMEILFDMLSDEDLRFV
jgi:hypothetical protein